MYVRMACVRVWEGRYGLQDMRIFRVISAPIAESAESRREGYERGKCDVFVVDRAI